MKKRLTQRPMRPFIYILSFILVSGLVFGISLKNEDPNKDKLLLEIISYVLDRGHYDPKEINDAFSENVFMNYLENIDGQHRFFIKSDINTFDSYRYRIDDELKNTQLDFFNLSYNKLMERMEQVQKFYESLLDTLLIFHVKRR
jgi:carboxyl-terminal processing protease